MNNFSNSVVIIAVEIVKGLLQQLFKPRFVLFQGRSHSIAPRKFQANVPDLSQLLLETSA